MAQIKIDLPKDTWVLIAGGILDGTAYCNDGDSNYYGIRVLAGEAAPTDPLDARRVEVFQSQYGPTLALSALAASDFYMLATGSADEGGSVVVDA